MNMAEIIQHNSILLFCALYLFVPSLLSLRCSGQSNSFTRTFILDILLSAELLLGHRLWPHFIKLLEADVEFIQNKFGEPKNTSVQVSLSRCLYHLSHS